MQSLLLVLIGFISIVPCFLGSLSGHDIRINDNNRHQHSHPSVTYGSYIDNDKNNQQYSPLCGDRQSNDDKILPCKWAHVRWNASRIGKGSSEPVSESNNTLETGKLLAILELLDESRHVVKILIDAYHSPVNDKTIKVAKLAMELDEFLVSRLWWNVIMERDVETANINYVDYHVVLLRASSTLEPQLRILSAVQFPPSLLYCKQSSLMLGRMLNKGWGSQLTLAEMTYFPFYIFNIWDSKGNDPNESIMYASSGLCPTVVNKRECMNLPMTNCTMPKSLTSLRGESALDHNFWRGQDFLYFANITDDGLLERGKVLDMTLTSEYIQRVLQKYTYDASKNKPAESGVFLDAKGSEMLNKNWGSIIAPYALMLRPNARYRHMIADVVHKFRKATGMHALGKEQPTCTVFQIRRGDRIAKNFTPSSTKQYCDSFLQFAANGTCIHRPSQDWTSCGPPDDRGCFSFRAYGELSLTDYLELADKLNSKAKVAFISTDDDGSWLQAEIEKLPKKWADWKMFALPARNDFHSEKVSTTSSQDNVLRPHIAGLSASSMYDSKVNIDHNQGIAVTRHQLYLGDMHLAIGRETLASIELHATIALARQCSSYIGHFGSGFAVAFYRLLCFQHGYQSGSCPDAADIGNIYNDQGNTIFRNTV